MSDWLKHQVVMNKDAIKDAMNGIGAGGKEIKPGAAQQVRFKKTRDNCVIKLVLEMLAHAPRSFPLSPDAMRGLYYIADTRGRQWNIK